MDFFSENKVTLDVLRNIVRISAIVDDENGSISKELRRINYTVKKKLNFIIKTTIITRRVTCFKED
jgi:hypothetical protein